MRSDTITMEAEIAELEAEVAALREKAALWNALVEKIQAGYWIIEVENNMISIDQIERYAITADSWGSIATTVGSGATLAEAVRLAMEAEGER